MSRTKLAMLRIFTWFHVLCVSTLTFGATDISQLTKPTGRVTLFSFERGHLRTLVEGVDKEVVLTAPPRYFEAYVFECNSTFPVQWAYIGEAAPVVTADVGRFFQDFYDVNTYTYQSILMMYSLQELQSGRYICRGASKEHDKLAIHYDVFVPGNGTQILLSTSEKKLFVPETKEHAYIPCGVSDSTAVVNLYRGNQWGTFYPVPVNGSITFSPRKGFKIRFKDFLDPWGTYLCVSETNKKRRKVHLIPESLKAKYDMINHVSGKIPVYFSYEYEYNRVLCCTGTNFIPKLQWAGCGSILDCQVKSACFEEDRCEQRLGNSGYNPTKWIDPGPLPPGCSGYRLRDDPNGDFGLFKCSTPGIAQYQPYLLNRGNIFLDFEKTPPSEMILTLQRISPEGPSFVGDEVEFHCNSTRFYFAYGIRWGWEKASGEIEFIDDSAVVRDKYSVRGHRRRTTLKISSPEIKSIICFVPVVNSATEWRTVSLPVVIATNESNFISPQIPVSNNNLIDLDSITYQTDYDALNPAPAATPQQGVQQQPEQNLNLQVYNSAKTPYQEIQAVVPPASPVEQHRNNPNYYSYTHESSGDTTHATHRPHPPSIPETRHHQLHSNELQSHQSSSVHPIAQPHTVDVYSQSVHVSTTSPNIISISRSKKNRNRPGSSGAIPTTSRTSSKNVPNLKPDVQYDTVDRDIYGSSYDTFEPRPSSSSKSNTKLHTGRTNSQYSNHHQNHQNHQRSQASSRIPYEQKSSSTHTGRREPSSASISSRRPYYSRNEILYSTTKKSYRDYENYNEKKTEFGVDMRLSLPFEPVVPSRSRYAHAGNYSTIPSSATSSRVSSSSTSSKSHNSGGDRSHSRRPAPSNSQSQSRPYSRHDHERQRNNDDHHHNQQEKDYTMENSYSQYVRLSLPAANTISTQLPKLQKATRGRDHTYQTSHNIGHGRGRSHTSTDGRSNSNPPTRHSTDYYYTDESPVEIKVPHSKAHDPFINSQRGRSRQDSHRQHHSSTTRQNKNDHLSDTVEPEEQHHESSPTTYYRRRPTSSDDYHASSQKVTTQQAPSRQDHSQRQHHTQRQDHSTHSTHSRQQSQHHHHSSQPHDHEFHRERHEQYHESRPGHHESFKSSGRHRSAGRGLKFNGDEDTTAEGAAVPSYEFTSPTARPAYFVSTPQQFQSSNEFINNADMELKRMQPHQRTRTSPSPLTKPSTGKAKNNSSADIVHSVSISISSRISHDGENGNNARDSDQLLAPLSDSDLHIVSDDSLVEKPHNEIHETAEDYDVYSPQYTNYKATTVPPPVPKPVVPIQFLHVKPKDISTFQPAKTTIDEDDEYDIG